MSNCLPVPSGMQISICRLASQYPLCGQPRAGHRALGPHAGKVCVPWNARQTRLDQVSHQMLRQLPRPLGHRRLSHGPANDGPMKCLSTVSSCCERGQTPRDSRCWNSSITSRTMSRSSEVPSVARYRLARSMFMPSMPAEPTTGSPAELLLLLPGHRGFCCCCSETRGCAWGCYLGGAASNSEPCGGSSILLLRIIGAATGLSSSHSLNTSSQPLNVSSYLVSECTSA